jgi:hypothetical protein
MKCKLTIASHGNGWSDKVTDVGQMNIEDGVATVNYKIDGDLCNLTISEEFVEQERKGENNIKISFRQGEKTLCIIGDDELRGGYSVFTKTLTSKVGTLGCNVSLNYISGNDNEEINLTIRAIYNK